MASFLFWNLCRKRLEAVLRRLVVHYNVDVLILAECVIPQESMLAALNANGSGSFHRIPAVASRGLELYSRFDGSCFGDVVNEADHYLIRTLTVPDGIEIVLAMAHLASAMHKKPKELHSRCVGFGQSIRDAEKKVGNDRTLVVGDLNLNPFHDGMLDVRGLSALPDRRTVLRKHDRRFGKVNVEVLPVFYNPMWSHFGDAVEPAGTYYYDKSNPEVDPLWNIFDQVLLRPALLERFQNKDLKILTRIDTESFIIDDGRPNGRVYSDHLPIWFQLDLRQRAEYASS